MTMVLAVAVGGALGSVLRYLTVRWVGGIAGVLFPWGTLAVNAIGGLVIGALSETFAQRWSVGPEMRAFLITGVLGGFTTFSAFSLEVVALYERGAAMAALGYVAASVILAVGGVMLGMAALRNWA